MTDETRPETTPPTPDESKPGPADKGDSLDSWFRPQPVERTAQPEPQPAAVAEKRVQEPDQDERPDQQPGQGDEAAEGADDEPGNGNDVTQIAARTPVEPTEDTSGAAEVDSGGRQGDQSAAATAEDGEREGGDGGGVAGAGEAEGVDRAGAGASEAAGVDRAGTGAGEGGSAAPSGDGGVGNDKTQVIPAAVVEPARGSDESENERTQVFPATPPGPVAPPPAAAAQTQAIPRPATVYPRPAESDMAVRPATGAESWSPAPGPRQQYQAPAPPQAQPQQRPGARQAAQPQYQQAQPAQAYQQPYQQPQQQRTQAYQRPGGVASILPPRGHDGYDDFDDYSYGESGEGRPRGRARRALLVSAGIFVLIVAVAAVLVFSGKVKVPGISAGPKPVPTVGFSPSSTDAGSAATQTGAAFLTDWQNGNLKAAANITDNQSAALAQLTAYKNDLKVSGLTLIPGTASAQGWMTFSVNAQVGTPSSAWSYSSGMATYSSNVDGYTRWFVKWQPNVLFTSLKSGQKLTLGLIPPVANKVVDRNGAEITSANAPSLNGIVSALEKAAPAAAGTPGQEVEVVNADGSVASKVSKLSDPVALGAVKTTFDMRVEAAAQAAVNQAPNSSMVVIQPSTGNILAVANNPTTGYDNAMAGHYAPGSTFKTITTTLVLNKGVISDLNQTWDCPQVLNADGITLHNSEQEAGVGKSFLWDFAQSCNNAFSRFEGRVSRTDLASAAHDYYGFNQKWDVGLGVPTTYGYVPDTSSNSLAEELVGQDRITASPVSMASVAATIDTGSFKQPIMVPGTAQIPGTALSASTDNNLKTLMHEVVVSGTLAGVFNGEAGVYAKTGTAEVQGKAANSWTVAFKGDYAVAALAIGGNYGAQTAGPEVKSLLNSVG